MLRPLAAAAAVVLSVSGALADCSKLSSALAKAQNTTDSRQLVEIMSGIDPANRPHFEEALSPARNPEGTAQATVIRWISGQMGREECARSSP